MLWKKLHKHCLTRRYYWVPFTNKLLLSQSHCAKNCLLSGWKNYIWLFFEKKKVLQFIKFVLWNHLYNKQFQEFTGKHLHSLLIHSLCPKPIWCILHKKWRNVVEQYYDLNLNFKNFVNFNVFLLIICDLSS